MKISNLSKITLAAAIVFAVFSCSKSNGISNTTGWKYNDKNSTGFVVKGEIKGKVPPNMVAIEGGTFTMGAKTDFETAPRNNFPRRVTVRSFYMDKYEISNVNWQEYVHWMSLVFGEAAPELVAKVQPNKNVWREDPLAYNEPYVQYYFDHPSFAQYPIVGVSWEQANDYCQWRTDRINELALINAGVISAPDFKSIKGKDWQDIAENFVFNTKKYTETTIDQYNPTSKKQQKDLFGNNVKVGVSSGILFQDVRLPNEAEWEYAAYGLKVSKNNKQGFVPETREYPWSGDQLRVTKKGKYQGTFMANFVIGRGDMMGTAGALNDRGLIAVPVNSYFPNDFGLYNMAGNVNEWVADVYRSTTSDEVSEYNPYRGNVYTENVVSGQDENGNNIFEIDSLGRIRQAIVKDGDKRNYKDGDPQSLLMTDFLLNGDTTGLATLQKNNVKVDPTDVLSPGINDEMRVYKGGSWKDRVYWLSPSSRRFLNQKKTTSDIGFRCAMDMIGETQKPIKQ